VHYKEKNTTVMWGKVVGKGTEVRAHELTVARDVSLLLRLRAKEGRSSQMGKMAESNGVSSP
jgi:hypothetical protein